MPGEKSELNTGMQNIRFGSQNMQNEQTVMQSIERMADLQEDKLREYKELESRLNRRIQDEVDDLVNRGIMSRDQAERVLKREAQKEAAKFQRTLDQETIKEYNKIKDKTQKEAAKKDVEEAKRREKAAQRKEIIEQWDETGGFAGKIKDVFKEFERQKTAGFVQTAKETGTENLIRAMKQVGKNIEQGLNAINQSISKYAQYQTAINTRLQGTGRDFSNVAKTLNKVAWSPLVKAEDLYSNVNKLVEEGISYNLEQRAFLMTVKDGIATTFDADNATLRRLIRVQQQDSTAARLGMESFLTQFLNEFVQSTEYLTTTFDNVADHLLEASALLGSADASAEFEYIVQKWLGALTGIGLSDSTATAIAQAIGELGSGDITNLGSSNIQNLLVMAAARSGLDYAGILSSGLDAFDTNKLLRGVTYYLQELGKSESNVVRNQLAKTFGVSVSDLAAVTKNLSEENISNLFNSMMSYTNMNTELVKEMGSLSSRIGIANILENLMSNITFQTGMNIGANPALFAAWKVSDLIQSVTGGINIPYISALGSGIDLNTTAENLVKLGIVGAGFLGNIPKIIRGITNIGKGESLLSALGIGELQSLEIQKRGEGLSTYTIDNSGTIKRTSGTTTSASAYVGNIEEGTAYSESATEEAKRAAGGNPAEDEENNLMIYLREKAELDVRLGKIVEDLDSLVDGVTIKQVSSGPSSITGFTESLSVL